MTTVVVSSKESTMSRRPLKYKKIEFLVEYERANHFSLDSLRMLWHELEYRNTQTYPRYGALKARVEERLAELEEIHELLSESFKSEVFKEWFFGAGKRREIFDSAVTTGSMPLAEADFDELLLRHNITPHYLGTDLETLIVGQADYNTEELLRQLDLRSGKSIKIYSQEMVFAFLGCGKDPFDSEEILQYFGFNHPALESLMELGFEWPSTYAAPGTLSMPEADWPDEGMLRHMGYVVGKNGVPRDRRRKILKQVFETRELPKLHSRAYMRQWGGPREGKRLQKMANSIATFAKNRKRHDPDLYKLAISHWERDLQWLKDTFYTGRFQFQWPSTHVGSEYRKR